MKIGWLCLAIASAACGTDARGVGAEVTGRAAARITSGASDPGDPAVVVLVDTSGNQFCTGTLVAPYVVLTAAHCTSAPGIADASAVFGTSLGSADGSTGGASIPIATTVAHPGFDLATLTDDIALAVLSAAAPAAPLRLGTSAPAVGATVRLVGWGLDAADGSAARKREGTATVTEVDATTFAVGPAPSLPCQGDSGGPALDPTGAVVGVTSSGDGDCARRAVYSRVDAFLGDFLAPAMASFAPGAAPAGAPCLFPERCAGGAGACVVAPDDANVSYCTAPCGANADCPAGMTCASVGDATQCRYPLPTPGTIGAACRGDADCLEGRCTGLGVCGVRCVPGGAACPGTSQCTQTGGIDFFCVAAPVRGAAGSACAVSSSPAGGRRWPAAIAACLALGWARMRRVRGTDRRRRRGPGGAYCSPTNTCVQCLSKRDCPGIQRCQNNQCIQRRRRYPHRRSRD